MVDDTRHRRLRVVPFQRAANPIRLPAPTGDPYAPAWPPLPTGAPSGGGTMPPSGPGGPHTEALPSGSPQTERRSRSVDGRGRPRRRPHRRRGRPRRPAAAAEPTTSLGSVPAGSGVDGPAGRQHRQDRRRRAAERGHHPDRDRRRQRDRVRLRHRQPGPHPHQQPRRDGGWQSGTITVELNNGKTLPAKIAGSDASSDLAVLKIDATDIPPLQFGASKDVVVGDGVIAVGAPLGLDATVTSGIVSALNRPVTPGDGSDQSFINAIQTDGDQPRQLGGAARHERQGHRRQLRHRPHTGLDLRLRWQHRRGVRGPERPGLEDGATAHHDRQGGPSGARRPC